MNKLAYKISASVAGALIWGSLMAPQALAETSLEISENGTDSTNTISVSISSDCQVKQTANTQVLADVETTASTGNNQASGNTGGSVAITTGDATASSMVTVTGGSNTANNPCCCKDPCEEGNKENSAVIFKNGDGSTNDILVAKTKTMKVKQKANTEVLASVKTRAKTGRNKAKNNTGSGVTVDTGKADSTSEVDVSGGTNSLTNP